VRRPRAGDEAPNGALRVVLDVRAPFDSVSAFAFLRARAVPGADLLKGDSYVRAVALAGAVGTIAL
jgi:AraC family transcriptional regulator, regulatory protein of adaptative response / DNA-3-methyladenine glycosylase II